MKINKKKTLNSKLASFQSTSKIYKLLILLDTSQNKSKFCPKSHLHALVQRKNVHPLQAN